MYNEARSRSPSLRSSSIHLRHLISMHHHPLCSSCHCIFALLLISTLFLYLGTHIPWLHSVSRLTIFRHFRLLLLPALLYLHPSIFIAFSLTRLPCSCHRRPSFRLAFHSCPSPSSTLELAAWLFVFLGGLVPHTRPTIDHSPHV